MFTLGLLNIRAPIDRGRGSTLGSVSTHRTKEIFEEVRSRWSSGRSMATEEVIEPRVGRRCPRCSERIRYRLSCWRSLLHRLRRGHLKLDLHPVLSRKLDQKKRRCACLVFAAFIVLFFRAKDCQSIKPFQFLLEFVFTHTCIMPFKRTSGGAKDPLRFRSRPTRAL